jgi:hypothetical protein
MNVNSTFVFEPILINSTLEPTLTKSFSRFFDYFFGDTIRTGYITPKKIIEKRPK